MPQPILWLNRNSALYFYYPHDWLARKLDTAGIKDTQCDNVFVWREQVFPDLYATAYA